MSNLTHDLVPFDEVPIPGIRTVVPVITQHEVFIYRNRSNAVIGRELTSVAILNEVNFAAQLLAGYFIIQ